jgi:tRNA:m(5)U-54 methyltransferase
VESERSALSRDRGSGSGIGGGLQSTADSLQPIKVCGLDDGDGEYLNCPLTSTEYRTFYAALTSAESATIHDFDREKFFEGCLPIEVMAHRGEDTLRFGR